MVEWLILPLEVEHGEGRLAGEGFVLDSGDDLSAWKLRVDSIVH